ALVGAALGAAAGRLVARWRADSEAGLDPQLDMAAAQPRPRALVPGLVAALRVTDRPWSYLHSPAWLAAFGVNFAVAALARELGPLLRALGVRGMAEDEVEERGPAWTSAGPRTEIWTTETPSTPPSGEPAPSTPGFRPFAG